MRSYEVRFERVSFSVVLLSIRFGFKAVQGNSERCIKVRMEGERGCGI